MGKSDTFIIKIARVSELRRRVPRFDENPHF